MLPVLPGICALLLGAVSAIAATPERVATGLEIPWAMAFTPDGRILVTERPGRVRVIVDDELQDEPWAEVPVANWRAAGLSGIAIDPAYDENRYVYVVGTVRVGEDGFENRIYRFTDAGAEGQERTLVLGGLESVDTHAGGAFGFGPDGKLYIAVGDGERIEEVQDMQSPTGKILRLNADGSMPDDNPFQSSPVYALGQRNPQGFAWHPETGDLFATEHGPSGFETEGGRTDQDEFNHITAGGNYGWPNRSGLTNDDRFISPLIEWSPAIAPSGLTIVSDRSSPCYGHAIAAGMRGQQLRLLKLQRREDGSWAVTSDHPVFFKKFGRIRAVSSTPDGNLYFTTSNRNTPGEPIRKLARDGDDSIYKLSLRAPESSGKGNDTEACLNLFLDE